MAANQQTVEKTVGAKKDRSPSFSINTNLDTRLNDKADKKERKAGEDASPPDSGAAKGVQRKSRSTLIDKPDLIFIQKDEIADFVNFQLKTKQSQEQQLREITLLRQSLDAQLQLMKEAEDARQRSEAERKAEAEEQRKRDEERRAADAERKRQDEERKAADEARQKEDFLRKRQLIIQSVLFESHLLRERALSDERKIADDARKAADEARANADIARLKADAKERGDRKDAHDAERRDRKDDNAAEWKERRQYDDKSRIKKTVGRRWGLGWSACALTSGFGTAGIVFLVTGNPILAGIYSVVTVAASSAITICTPLGEELSDRIRKLCCTSCCPQPLDLDDETDLEKQALLSPTAASSVQLAAKEDVKDGKDKVNDSKDKDKDIDKEKEKVKEVAVDIKDESEKEKATVTENTLQQPSRVSSGVSSGSTVSLFNGLSPQTRDTSDSNSPSPATRYREISLPGSVTESSSEGKGLADQLTGAQSSLNLGVQPDSVLDINRGNSLSRTVLVQGPFAQTSLTRQPSSDLILGKGAKYLA